MCSKYIKDVITTSKEPLVINNILDWSLIKWNLEKWSEVIGDTELQFRLGHKSYTTEPQWERQCEKLNGSFKDFLEFSEENKWLYFDYKYMNEWFVDKHELREAIKWDKFGFETVKAEESTIWIGTQGAHTPCHVDTYGCNLIAQLFGRKLWLLFPPEVNLEPTRIPYEESTIYSKINFYSPSKIFLESIADEDVKCKKIILEPGQVLFVPNGWWHYVENLETAISINTWLPLPGDDEKRINEAITLMMVKLASHGVESDEQHKFINDKDDIQQITTLDVFQLVDKAILNFTQSKLLQSETQVEKINKLIDNVKKIDTLTTEELKHFLNKKRVQFKASDNDCEGN